MEQLEWLNGWINENLAEEEEGQDEEGQGEKETTKSKTKIVKVCRRVGPKDNPKLVCKRKRKPIGTCE